MNNNEQQLLVVQVEKVRQIKDYVTLCLGLHVGEQTQGEGDDGEDDDNTENDI